MSHRSGSSLSQRGSLVSPTVSHVTYSDLCFPKTSNYGSMRKQGRWEAPTHTSRLSQRL